MQNYEVKAIAPDSGLTQLVRPYKAELDAKMDEVIGKADTTLTKQQPECTLGNFMADAQLWSARSADPTVKLSVANYGGIRISYLQQGPIKLRNMYELMPFDNTLCIVELPGSALQQLCDHMASLKGWPISGFSYVIKDKKATNILVNEKPLEENTVYKVVMSDYIANGGDNCAFLKPYKQKMTNILIREALISYVRVMTNRNATIHPQLENRVTHAE
jgi:2',3'-cyclic-nucleotide 2'-phosphodiesterase (5'-nucleotidase family)